MGIAFLLVSYEVVSHSNKKSTLNVSSTTTTVNKTKKTTLFRMEPSISSSLRRHDDNRCSNTTTTTTTTTGTHLITLRLHLIRHGETIANVNHHVIGQTDSPLTNNGIKQALCLGTYYRSKWSTTGNSSNEINPNTFSDNPKNSEFVTTTNSYFWRMYSSDLLRTKHTTQLILQNLYPSSSACPVTTTRIIENDIPSSPSSSVSTSWTNTYDVNDNLGKQHHVQYDKRLREIARGIRQGLSKSYTMEQANTIYRNGQHPLYPYNTTTTTAPTTSLDEQPLYETDEDGYHRFYTLWLMDVIHDVCEQFKEKFATPDCSSETTNSNANLQYTTTNTILQDVNSIDQKNPYNVLVVSHGALMRVFLQKYIGMDRIQQYCNTTNGTSISYKQDPQNDDQYRLDIPNTSVSILDFNIDIISCTINDVTIVQLTDTKHIK